jgi:hypothetical protein
VVALLYYSDDRAHGRALERRAEDGANGAIRKRERVAQPSQADDAGGRPWWALLSHPLLLLLLGAGLTAAVTNYVAPRITHEWQRRDRAIEIRNDRSQKELEVKAALARNIGESIGAFLATMHSTEFTTHGKPGPAYDRAYGDWSMHSNGIASQIRVYFGRDGINEKWDEYAATVRTLYYLWKYDGRDYVAKRLSSLEEINLYLKDKQLGREQLEEIARFEISAGDINDTLDAYLRRLLDDFRERADQLITTILATDSVLTQSAPERPTPAHDNGATAREASDPSA